ncbi:hypothetical protein BVC71_09035 [Marivivens niveibacter]|uniref:Abortive infection protein-like C-terminal domain-containing protein n=2 Tax=Marivivens niveibacter TaxID=1930667 RepID=A0A251WWP6_9RHOB|nr:hypothetical protein BVC71_09035 [Marivivens niveibacter]
MLDCFQIEGAYYGGEMNDVDFLSRHFDLSSFPSDDSRFETMEGEVYCHCVSFDDYTANWALSDRRLSISELPDEKFLAFLADTISPAVRKDKTSIDRFASHFNNLLEGSGWKLVQKASVAGLPRYVPMLDGVAKHFEDKARNSAKVLSSSWMQGEIDRAWSAVDSDPALAIGTAKDLTESCCKAILLELGKPAGPRDDFPTITKAVVKELRLVPESISKEAKGAEIIKRLLSNLLQVTKGVNELRSLYGTGHGRDGKHVGLQPRHARLAVTAAAAFTVFITDTYSARHSD